MTHHILLGLSGIVVLGISAQWLAWRLRVPSILVLLLFGVLAGPVIGVLDPDELLGPLLLPLVALSVAVILFEGGLSLRLRDLREMWRGLGGLVTIGVLIAWGLGALAAHWILGFEVRLAVLLGAILVVTGPTVVIPLLRHVRPRGAVGNLVKWEGILNDPVGAVLAMLVFEAIVAGEWGTGTQEALMGVLRTLAGGVLLGLGGGGVMVVLLRYYHIPDYLENSFALMMVVVLYTVSDTIQPESGLLSVTILGIALANQRWVTVKHIVEFKENLRVLLISVLFILLAARLALDSLYGLGWGSLVFLLVLITVVRPATVFLSTIHSRLSWREKLFLSWMAPRGIVAAAVASVFALRLGEEGYAQAASLVPVVFVVIVGTVLFYGLTAGPAARRLGVSGGTPQGCLVAGAHSWARKIAEALHQAGLAVVLVDSNRTNISRARMAGLPAVHGNLLAESMPDELPLDGIGKLLALTANDEVNSLAVLHFTDVFGKKEVYQLPRRRVGSEKDSAELPADLRGRILFGSEMTFAYISQRFAGTAILKTTTLTEEFSYDAFRELYGDTAVPLFVLEGKTLRVVTEDSRPPRPAQTVIAVVEAPPEVAENKAKKEPSSPAGSAGKTVR